MHENGGWLGRAFGPPKGRPGLPLLEAVLVLAVFCLTSYGFGVTGSPPSSPAYHASILAMNVSRALLLLCLMVAGEGLRAFGIKGPSWADIPHGALCALGAFALAFAAALAFSALGAENPLFAARSGAPRAGAALIPLLLASSMATGYGEELFFRSYLIRRLGQAGFPPPWAALASSLAFGSLHGGQGAVGLVSASLLGLFFAWRWQAGSGIHEIALGHGLYDAAVLALLLYS
jgi:uncharacterized protein